MSVCYRMQSPIWWLSLLLLQARLPSAISLACLQLLLQNLQDPAPTVMAPLLTDDADKNCGLLKSSGSLMVWKSISSSLPIYDRTERSVAQSLLLSADCWGS